MNHLPPLVTDLALILGVAAVITLIFKRLKQPLVLGYIVSGIIVSPNFTFFPTIYEINNVQVWGQIGVILLLFTLGLEFSFKKLAKIGGSASVTAGFEAIGMGLLGFVVGKILHWPLMDCIFLGATLMISSSTIVIKTFDDLGLKQKKFAGLVFGVLVVEDMIAVTILVLLGTFVVKQEFDGSQVLLSIVKLIFFLVLWFIAGILFIPSLLKRTQRFLTDELLLLVSIAMCFLMVYFSSMAGFSAALGAFIMGSLLAETTKAEKIEHLVKPVKDLFGAIFFVSVGMLINLNIIGEYLIPILIITATCIFGKIIVIGLGAYLSGNSLKVALQTSMSLALIGEFSFIIAALGQSLNAISTYLYPIIISVSAITTFIEPYLVHASVPLSDWILKKLPETWQHRLNKYSIEASSAQSTSDWQKVISSFLINCIVNSVVIVAIIILSTAYILPWLAEFNYGLGGFTASFISLLAIAPFIWGLLIRNEKTETFARIFSQKKYIGPIWITRIIKISLAILFITLILKNIFSTSIAIYSALGIFMFIILFRHNLQRLYDSIEERFIKNLNNREIEEQQTLAKMQAERRDTALAPWDAHMTTFMVPSESSEVIGKTLQELQWRERIGVNVALIKRGYHTIITPDRYEKIYPNDKLYIICTDGQEKRMNAILRINKRIIQHYKETEIKLERFIIQAESSLIHKNIKESGIRTKTNGLVVGIERNGKRILNPESNFIFEEGDWVWIVGEKKLVNETIKQ